MDIKLRNKITQSNNSADIEKFAHIGKCTSALLHDITNSVHVISLSLDQIHHPPQQRKLTVAFMLTLIEDISSATQRIENFICDAHNAMHHNLNCHSFSVIDSIQKVLNNVQPRAKKLHVIVKLTTNSSTSMLFGNPTQFAQIMSNIVSNALEAYEQLENRTTIKIIQIDLINQKHAISIKISDNAGGIATKYIDRIFEPFFSLKDKTHHSGIGLAITKIIVEEEFHGRIHCESKEGEGTTFTVEIPKK